MKINSLLKPILLLPLIIVLLVSACQNENVEVTDSTDEQKLLVSDSELVSLLVDLVAGNDDDDDDDDDGNNECLKFNYPILASIYDVEFQVVENITIRNNMNFEDFIEGLEDSSLIAGLNFPISLMLEDNSNIEVNNNNELLQALKACD